VIDPHSLRQDRLIVWGDMRPTTMSQGETFSLFRTHDAATVNRVINAPEVRPFVGAVDAGDLDISGLLSDTRHVALMGEHGGFLLTWSAPWSFEVHTFILNGGRGAWAREAARQTIDYAWRRLNADCLWTKIPADQPNVRAFAVQMGMRDIGFDEDGYGVFAMRKGD